MCSTVCVRSFPRLNVSVFIPDSSNEPVLNLVRFTANLLEKQYVNYLVELLTLIPLEEPKETVLNAMLTFIEGFYDAICECKKEEHNLKPILEYLIAHYKDEVVVSMNPSCPLSFFCSLIFCDFLGRKRKSYSPQRRTRSICSRW